VKKILAIAGAVILVVFILLAAFADVLPLKDPLTQDAAVRLQAPDSQYLMGTDNFGRDVFSRIVYGARSSLYVAVASVVIGTLLGAVAGIVSAYRGGWTDMIVQRLTDALLGFPILVLAILVVVSFGPSVNTVMVAIAIAVLPQMVRLSRSRALSIKEETFISTARAVGVSTPRILLRHILPHTASPVLAYATAFVGIALIAESAIQFLGLGVPPPEPSWGGILQGGRPYLEVAPWLAIFPGLVLSAAVFSFIFVGDALRDLLDPRERLR